MAGESRGCREALLEDDRKARELIEQRTDPDQSQQKADLTPYNRLSKLYLSDSFDSTKNLPPTARQLGKKTKPTTSSGLRLHHYTIPQGLQRDCGVIRGG